MPKSPELSIKRLFAWCAIIKNLPLSRVSHPSTEATAREIASCSGLKGLHRLAGHNQQQWYRLPLGAGAPGQWVVPARQDGLMSILTPILPDNQTLPMLHNQVCRCFPHPNEPRLTSQDERRSLHN